MRLQLFLLGSFRVILDDREVVASDWHRGRSAALVKLLGLSAGHRIHREHAMDTLWPDLDADAASANLRKAIHFARRTLAAHDALSVEIDVVSLAPHGGMEVDVEQFEAAATAALRSKNVSECARAADLYGGDLLPDDRYAAWTDESREHLRQTYLRVLRAGQLWDRLVAVDPTNEEAQRALMQAALDAGNRADVIRQFQRLRERLRIDFGVGPAASTVAIYERALAGQAAEPVTVMDRVRASLAWGIIHLNSGDFAKAEQIAREARTLAIDAGLAREVGEASALFGLVAHMQGKWPALLKTEFIDWMRRSPAFVSNAFDGQLCLAEFCLCGTNGHDAITSAAHELLEEATRLRSKPGQAIATLILGERELFSNHLDEAETLLREAEGMYEQSDSVPGRVMCMQRLAEVGLARGQKWKAGRLAKQGLRIASSNWLEPHLLMRLQALAVEAATSKTKAAAEIAQGDRWLSQGTMCQPCSMGFRVASSIALAQAGELEQAGRRIDEAERLAGMWNGGPWVAAIWEARGVHRRAQGHDEQAAALFREAAARYASLGRRSDEARCLARAAPA